MSRIFTKLENLLTKDPNAGFVLGIEERNWYNQIYFNFVKFRNIVEYEMVYLKKLLKNRNPNFRFHEVVHGNKKQRKVIFDIDLKEGTAELFQEVVDSLISALLKIFPDLDLSKEIAFCTSHGNNIYSAHIILQRTIFNFTK